MWQLKALRVVFPKCFAWGMVQVVTPVLRGFWDLSCPMGEYVDFCSGYLLLMHSAYLQMKSLTF